MPIRYGRRSEDVSMGQLVKNGMVWMTGTNKVAVASNSVMKSTISVASGQPKGISLIGTSLYADSEVFTDIHINPTTNLPTTTKRIDNSILGIPYSGVVTFKSDVAASNLQLTGGAVTGVSMAIGETSGGGRDMQSSIIIMPGYTIGFNTVTTGATNIMMNITWIEM